MLINKYVHLIKAFFIKETFTYEIKNEFFEFEELM